jgi:hypothetical protein
VSAYLVKESINRRKIKEHVKKERDFVRIYAEMEFVRKQFARQLVVLVQKHQKLVLRIVSK